MPIATTLGALVEADPALGRLAMERAPVATAYAIAKLARVVADEARHFYDLRNALVRDFGDPPAAGADPVVVPGSPAWPSFAARVTELAAVPVTVDAAPIDLSTVPGLTITPADLIALGALVVCPNGTTGREPEAVAGGGGQGGQDRPRRTQERPAGV